MESVTECAANSCYGGFKGSMVSRCQYRSFPVARISIKSWRNTCQRENRSKGTVHQHKEMLGVWPTLSLFLAF